MEAIFSCAYGLLCATNFEWPWPRKQPGLKPDVRMTLGDLGPFASYREADYCHHAMRAAGDRTAVPVVLVERGKDDHFRVSYADGARFIIGPSRDEIYGVSRSDLTLDDLIVYLQGPILGFLLRLRDVTCLHASAVDIGGRAIAVVGGAGMGKSTSAAAFAQLGLPVFTDDVLALKQDGDQVLVQPGLPRVLLWQESVAALFGSPEALPRIVSTWDKRYLDLKQAGFAAAEQPAPLAAIYVLGARLDGTAKTEITALEGHGALMQLVANTYANDFLTAAMRARELRALSHVISQVPVRYVRAPNDRGGIALVCQTILSDARSLRAQ